MTVLTNDSNSVGQRVLQKFKQMEGARVNWEGTWEEVAQYVIPNKDDVWNSRTSGDRRGRRLYTGMPVHTNEALASALHGMLTNPATIWFGLSSGDRDLDQLQSVQEWLQDSTARMINAMNQSNFQPQIHEVFMDLGSFGTSLLLVEEDDELMLRFMSRPIYMAYVAENAMGTVDTVAFKRERTARQLIQEFGEDNVSDEVRDDIDDLYKKYQVIHLVEPREFFDPTKEDAKSKPFASVHILQCDGHVLKESGFNEMPYIVTRWSKVSGEVYGRSPSMTAMPDIRMLNSMKRSIIEAAQKTINPPLQAPDTGVILPLRTGPGAINYYRAGTRDRIEPIFTGARPDLGEGIVAAVEADIEKAFFIDQLQIREADRMTATEIIQRREEQLRKLGPVLGRQHFELLKPLVNRVFSILARKSGFFKPAPEAIQGREIQVEFVSQIAKAQKTADADDLVRVFNLIAPLAQSKPQMLDNFNGDVITRDTVQKFGLNAKYLLDEDDVAQIRTSRQQQAQEQQQLEQAQQVTDIEKTASEAQV